MQVTIGPQASPRFWSFFVAMSYAKRNNSAQIKSPRQSGLGLNLSGHNGVSNAALTSGKSHNATVASGIQCCGLLTIREAAALLRVSESTIRNAIHNGQLKAFRFGARGGSIRIAPADLEDYTASCATDAKHRTTCPTGSGNGLFKALDGRKLLAAWRQQGVLDDPPNGNNVPSSESRYAP